MGFVKWVGAGVLATVVAVGAYQVGHQSQAAETTSQAGQEEMYTGSDGLQHQAVYYQPGHRYYVETLRNGNNTVGACSITPNFRQESHDWSIRTGAGNVEVGGIRGQLYVIGPNVPGQIRLTQDMCTSAAMHGGSAQITIGQGGSILQVE